MPDGLHTELLRALHLTAVVYDQVSDMLLLLQDLLIAKTEAEIDAICDRARYILDEIETMRG
jgi:hypothetical protein